MALRIKPDSYKMETLFYEYHDTKINVIVITFLVVIIIVIINNSSKYDEFIFPQSHGIIPEGYILRSWH